MKRLITKSFQLVTSPRNFFREQVKLPLAKFVYDTVDLYKSRTKTGVNNIREVLLRGSIVALLTALIVWLSIFMYVAFYYVYVPTITHEKPVYLTFRPCEKWDVHKGICSFPSGSVHFNQKQQSLMGGQPYKVFLELEMPESPTNKDLGMFMVCADFHSTDGRLITNSCRSAMLPYRSVLLDFLFKIIMSPFYMVRHFEEKQKVYIELFSSYLEPEGQKVTDIHIEVQTKHIEIYSAKFTISANFSGLRYVMFHWPILSAAIGITSNLFFIAIVSMISWYQIINSEEYLEYLKAQDKGGKVMESRRQYILNQETSSSEEEEVSLIGTEELEGLKKRKGSTSEC
ncbi:seipin [Coccinella septempunctata]|uniref:seipin n=1 Tax=Coccinella septempunctata TaxID=41139 RepID=UPI001D08C236|nr:seipin [Coccinella septempunctata]